MCGFSSTGASTAAAGGVVLSTRTFRVPLTSGWRFNSTSILAGGADGVLELDFFLVERDVELVLQFVGDHAGGDGAEQLAFLAGLDLDDADQLGQRLGQLGHGVELVRFALGAALLERLDLALVRRRDGHGQALREKKVARVAGGDADVVGFTAEADDVLRENDFSFCHTKSDVDLMR